MTSVQQQITDLTQRMRWLETDLRADIRDIQRSLANVEVDKECNAEKCDCDTYSIERKTEEIADSLEKLMKHILPADEELAA